MSTDAYEWMMRIFSSQLFWPTTILSYLYFSCCLYKTAQNCGELNKAWWAFVPLLQFLLMLRIANMPPWHVLIFLIPGVNLVALAIASVRIAQRCGLSVIWGVVTIIPVLNLIAMFKLAASKPKPSFFSIPSAITRSRTPQNVG